MTVAVRGVLAGVIAERIGVGRGLALLPLLVGAGADPIGVGCSRWPSRYDRAGGLALVFLAYAVAQGFEHVDRAIFDLGGVSGPHAQASGGRARGHPGPPDAGAAAAAERTNAQRGRVDLTPPRALARVGDWCVE